MANKYSEYFKINPLYFPCLDLEAIRAGAPWANTYPHETFVTLLRNVAKMLDGGKTPVWIHGAYGTGKSQCGHALKKILEVPEAELRKYWDKDAFSHVFGTNANKDLLEKLIGHKQRGIVTAYRYASGGIDGVRDLLIAVQDSVKEVLIANGVKYLGENTLRDSVLAWLEDPLNKKHFNEFLELPEFASRFSQSTADEVLADLRKGGELKELMDNIFYLADKRGIQAFELNTDRLVAWLKDVIAKNEIKIVLVWDEFSDYFKNNRNSLSEFQKIVSLCQSTPFYFVIITHQTSNVIANKNDDAWKVIQQRYDGGFVEITLPDSIAFDLIGSALEVNPGAKDAWVKIADTLNSYVPESRKAVMQAAGISDENVIKKIMPLHPYAAMILKYIATAFEANQRSMFNFIKTADNEDVKAFQWFILNTAYNDDRPLLTVDLLWDFFYVKGRNNLTADIQAILDTFPRQHDLGSKQQTVLKTILIMQAIGQRISGRADVPGKVTELFSVTDKNLSLAFEGVQDLEGNVCVGIAKQLVNDGVLYKKPIGNNQEVYAVAALAGDQTKIDNNKKTLRDSLTTAKLVTEGGLSTLLPLTSALKLRYDIAPPSGKLTTVTLADFKKIIDSYKGRDLGWHFLAVLAFARDDTEVAPFRKLIKEAAASDEYDNVIIIDALSTPLGADDFEQYLDYQSIAMYYSGPDNDLARKYAKDAKDVLDDRWRRRLEKGRFVVYTTANKDGDVYPNATSVISALQSAVEIKYPLVFDFNKGLTENMLKYTQGKSSVKHGAAQTSGGAVVGIEKFTLATPTNSVWKVDRYWEAPALSILPISKIKIDIEKTIADTFEHNNGQIAIRDIYDLLEEKYGFAASNLSSFLAGFLLKEYCTDTYRFTDSAGKPFDTTDRIDILGTMLSDYINNLVNNTPQKYKDTYIARRTPAENAFYKLSETAFGIIPDSCATVGVAALSIGRKMKDIGLPIWVLSQVDELGVYDIVEKYIALVQANDEGADAQSIAIDIGKIAMVKANLGNNLRTLITKENCQQGILEFLKIFEDCKILDLAKEIKAEANIIDDLRRLFNVERSYLWSKDTGLAEIRKLLTEYGIARETNAILPATANSLKTSLSAWREKLRYIHISAETLCAKLPELGKLIDYLSKIYGQNELLPDQLKLLLAEVATNGAKLADVFRDEKPLFAEVYEPYLDGLTDNLSEIIGKLPFGMFAQPASDCNIKVKTEAENFRKGQKKIELLTLWRNNAGSKNPKEWSTTHECPILIMVIGKDYDRAKKTFETLNQTNPPEFAINDALAFLKTATFFDDLRSEEKRNEAFVKHIIGDYAKMVNVGVAKAKLDRLTVDAYDWYSHPAVKAEIKKLAEAEYNAGGYDKVLGILNSMKPAERDEFIKQLVKGNVEVGIKIIAQGGN
jgi:hypothetical protein